MPNTYKLTAVEINPSGSTTIYTTPTSTTTLVKSLYLSNVSTGSINLSVALNKSGSATDIFLISQSSVPVQTTFQPISDTLVLQTGDALKVIAFSISSSDAIMSYMEIT
jgi:hypothetical protein